MEDLKNKKFSFGYEDTDKKLEINLYGLDFEINNLDSIDELENLDRDNSNVIEAQLEKILGEGSIDRINRKRVKDGYKELDLNIELSILGCIFEVYAKSMSGRVLDKVTKAVDDVNKDINSFNNMNREQRRNYNKNQYRNNRRIYRRY